MRGHSASKTRVNALVSRASRLGEHSAFLSEIAGTSPAMTPNVWQANTTSYPQIRLPDARIVGEHRGRALQPDAAGLDNQTIAGDLEGGHHVLLDQEDGDARAVDLGEHFAQPFHHARREAERELVDHQELRARHDPAADRAHLLLATRERVGVLALALAQDREQREDVVEVFLDAGVVTPQVGAE